VLAAFDTGNERERNVRHVSEVNGSTHLLRDLLVADTLFEGAFDDRLRLYNKRCTM